MASQQGHSARCFCDHVLFHFCQCFVTFYLLIFLLLLFLSHFASYLYWLHVYFMFYDNILLFLTVLTITTFFLAILSPFSLLLLMFKSKTFFQTCCWLFMFSFWWLFIFCNFPCFAFLWHLNIFCLMVVAWFGLWLLSVLCFAYFCLIFFKMVFSVE